MHRFVPALYLAVAFSGCISWQSYPGVRYENVVLRDWNSLPERVEKQRPQRMRIVVDAPFSDYDSDHPEGWASSLIDALRKRSFVDSVSFRRTAEGETTLVHIPGRYPEKFETLGAKLDWARKNGFDALLLIEEDQSRDRRLNSIWLIDMLLLGLLPIPSVNIDYGAVYSISLWDVQRLELLIDISASCDYRSIAARRQSASAGRMQCRAQTLNDLVAKISRTEIRPRPMIDFSRTPLE